MKPTFIIPYRNRSEHLRRIADHLLKVGQVVVIEQSDNKPFNRGKLLNIGFQVADLADSYPVFHDVDMVPHDPTCYLNLDLSKVCHLAGKASQFKYQMPYAEYLGGITAFSRENFEQINGFSNDFWGWGGEDDDLRNRVLAAGLEIRNYQAKFLSLRHQHNYEAATHQANVERLKAGIDQKSGLSNLKYESIAEISFPFKAEIQAFSVQF